MSQYEAGLQFFQESKYHQAIDVFEESLHKDILSSYEKIKVCELIIQSFNLINKEPPPFTFNLIKDIYLNEKNFSKAAQVMEQMGSTLGFSFNLMQELWMSYVEAGDISEAERVSKELITKAKKRKSYSMAFEHLLLSCEKIGKRIEVEGFKMEIALLQGNLHYLEEKLNSGDPDINELLKENIDIFLTEFNHLKNSRIVLVKYVEVLTKSSLISDYRHRKNFIKAVYEIVLDDNDKNDSIYVYLKDYCLLLENKEVAENLFQINGNLFSESELESIEAFKELKVVNVEIDLGEDLFSSESEVDANILKGKIEFLVENKRFEKAYELYQKIKSETPDFPEMDELEKIFNNTKSKIISPEVSIESILAEIRQNIDSNSDELDSDLLNQKVLVKTLRDEDIINYYEDFIYMFNTLGLFEASEEVYRRVEKRVDWSSEPKKFLNLRYLNFETKYSSGHYFSAIDLCDDLLNNVALTAKEFKCFRYLKAEACYKNENLNLAKTIFEDIFKADPEYRLTKRRLEEIERNK